MFHFGKWDVFNEAVLNVAEMSMTKVKLMYEQAVACSLKLYSSL